MVENNATTNQQREKQRWVVAVVAMVIAMVAAVAVVDNRDRQW
jgi:hypothetical protein